jgi:hypothetical protein
MGLWIMSITLSSIMSLGPEKLFNCCSLDFMYFFLYYPIIIILKERGRKAKEKHAIWKSGFNLNLTWH